MSTAYFEMVRWIDDDGPPQVYYRSKTLLDQRIRLVLDKPTPEHLIKDTVRFWARGEISLEVLQMSQRAWVEDDRGVVQTIKDVVSGSDRIGQAPDMTEKEWFLLKIKSTPL
jgi:hypothetical protein